MNRWFPKVSAPAVFSDDRKYRYVLYRQVSPLFVGNKTCLFVMLNPSTADEHTDDPTIRRCIDYCRRWGYAHLLVTNLSPLRATDPLAMRRAGAEPGDVRDRNIAWIVDCAKIADITVLAWGVHGVHEQRDERVLKALKEARVRPRCLRRTKDGHPQHPLMLPASLTPKAWADGGI